MSSVHDRPAQFDRREPIPGYKTVDLIGRGGYGEVWRAVAPGGLSKAVKIVFGNVDAAPAVAEKRALARIKDVRHPMLLSIERIEVIDGNLVIVMELADHSLKDEFVRAREAKQCGIAQGELLDYLRDTADALDFLYEKHSLQHLDVKPENVLLIAGRAKVGDFGLVKSLYERSASIVGGLTPTYAPPELFEGKPCRYSDQYSLAVVYMQMLTGVLPFIASNTAQMAAQHLNGVPDLSSLPRSQRPMIARALSKDPALRFPTCRAMVQALQDSQRAPELFSPGALPVSPVNSSPLLSSNTGSRTIALETPGGVESASTAPIPLPQPIPAGTTQQDTASLNSSTRTASSPVRSAKSSEQPVILVGVGGTGVEVLARTLQRLRDLRGNSSQWPAMHCLAIDSNTETLVSKFKEDSGEKVRIVPIPLKNSQNYGSKSTELLRWLGRRWLYNIPRDLKTDGFRPFGRLALLTNAKQVRDGIEATLDRLCGPIDAVDSRSSGPAPRVVLIGSISGGTASGSLLDLAYAFRSALKRRNLQDESVHGVLLHATPRGNAERDKARASAYAALREIHHCSRAGSHYTGEPSLGALPFHGDNAAFQMTHLFRMGDSLENADWDLAVEQVAEFVYCSNFTKASQISERAAQDSSRIPSARTYEILALGAGTDRIVQQMVQQACLDVIKLWHEGIVADIDPHHGNTSNKTLKLKTLEIAPPPPSEKCDEEVRKALQAGRLDSVSLLNDASDAIRLEVGSGAKEYIRAYVAECYEKTAKAGKGINRCEAVMGAIDRLVNSASETTASLTAQDSLYDQVVVRLTGRIRERVELILQTIRRTVDQTDRRLQGAQQLAAAMKSAVLDMQQRLMMHAAELREASLALALKAKEADQEGYSRFRLVDWALGRESTDVRNRDILIGYGETRLQESLNRAVARLYHVVDGEVTALTEQLEALTRGLAVVAEKYRTQPIPIMPSNHARRAAAIAMSEFRQYVLSQLNRRRRVIAVSIEQNIDSSILEGGAGLSRFLNPDSDVKRWLEGPLEQFSQRTVTAALHEIISQMMESEHDSAIADHEVDLVNLIASSCDSTGVATASDPSQLSLIVPQGVASGEFQSRLVVALPAAEVIPCDHADLTVCRTYPERSLGTFADEIIGGIELYKDLADRLLTRVDVTWSQFDASNTAASRSQEAPRPSPQLV